MAVHKQGYGLPRALRVAALALFAALTVAGRAAATDKNAVLILDGNTGQTIYQNAADELRHPASLAKMMTLYIVFEQIEQGRLSYDTKIKVSANAAAVSPSKLDLDESEEIALLDAVKALITKSANDMAVAVAEHIGGTEANFARLMDQKAARLGMTATVFKNASGLPDDEQVTTARDMLTLALHLNDDFPTHYERFSTQSFTYNGETFHNLNSLLLHFPGTDGLKTGYTQASGFNLVCSVRRGRKHVLGVVFGGASAAERDWAMQGYLTRALAEASSVRSRIAAPLAVARKRQGSATSVAFVPVPQRAVRRPDAAHQADAPDAARPAGLAGVPPAAAAVRAVSPPAAPILQASSPPPPTAPGFDREASLPASPAASPPPAPGVAIARVRQVRVGEPLHGSPPTAEPASIQSLIDEQSAPTAAAIATRKSEAARPAALGGDPASHEERGPAVVAASEVPSGTPAGTDRPGILAKTAPAMAAAAAGSFQIQIGAYQSEAEAQRQLALARTRLPLLLDHRAPVTQQVKHGERMIFRARYAGFEAEARAENVCQALKKVNIDCLVIRGQ